MAFVIVFSRPALRDLSHAEWSIRRVSARSVSRWRGLVLSAIKKLEIHPDRYAEADEAAELNLPLRELLFGKRPHVYRVLFTIIGQTVSIYRIRHAAQDHLTADDI